MTWACGIPLRDREGVVRRFAFVDAEDFERINALRWYLDSDGYVCRKSRWGERTYMHRAVLSLERSDGRHIDHRNRNPLDCRKANLRFATDAQNAQNQGARARTLRASQYRGVVWDKTRGKWRAQAVVNGKCHNLGRFDDELAAHRVVSAFRREHMPFSAEAAA